jgi:dihydroneopterin aldolase/2-amino-4-hydroxy-6-hydroxymethyldihydropteridine diphosphokinase/dihydropteroate synthase
MPEWIHPIAKRSIRSQLNILMHAKSADEPLMYKALPFPSARAHAHTEFNAIVVPSTAQYWKYPLVGACGVNIGPTHLMATLNATPDSFSDGSAHETVNAALSYVEESVVAGAHIIDVGGYSTRPGAAFVSPEEEIGRVVPIIQAVRSKSTSTPASTSESESELGAAIGDVLISVDTFRPEVAKAAVLAGANCINDVYAFVGPQYPLDEDSIRHFVDLRRLARELAVPVILMHSRGDAGQNKDYTAYQHANAKNVNGEAETGSVIEAIKNELGQRVEAAVRGPGGLRRWQIIVDPGVGFSKTLEGNLEVLRHASRITSDSFLVLRPRETTQEKKENPLFGFPQLIGASRKSFLGAILEREDSSNKYEGRATQPKERSFATAAAVVAAVQQGALITRVHDVLEMGDVVRVANAIWH